MCPTVRLQTTDVCNHSAVGHTRLLQLTVGPDKPIKLATPVSLTQLPPHVPILKENRASVFEIEESSQNPEQPLAKPDSIGEPEPPGCMDISSDLPWLLESTGSSDFSVGPSGLLQPTVSSDEPIWCES